MVTVAIWSSGTIILLPATAIGRRSILAALTRSSGCKRTATSRDSPVGSTQSPTSTPANATRNACAVSPTDIPSEFANPRLSSICSSSFGSCCESPTSTAPGTLESFSMKSPVMAISRRESGPENKICTGFRAPMFRSSSTVYSAPTICNMSLRRSTAISLPERCLLVLLPISTYTRPPPAFTVLLVATVSGIERASSAAFSTFSRAYSRLALDGMRTSMAIASPSAFGRKLEPPKVACNTSAPTNANPAIAAMERR